MRAAFELVIAGMPSSWLVGRLTPLPREASSAGEKGELGGLGVDREAAERLDPPEGPLGSRRRRCGGDGEGHQDPSLGSPE